MAVVPRSLSDFLHDTAPLGSGDCDYANETMISPKVAPDLQELHPSLLRRINRRERLDNVPIRGQHCNVPYWEDPAHKRSYARNRKTSCSLNKGVRGKNIRHGYESARVLKDHAEKLWKNLFDWGTLPVTPLEEYLEYIWEEPTEGPEEAARDDLEDWFWWIQFWISHPKLEIAS